jgi:hypothetical protein
MFGDGGAGFGGMVGIVQSDAQEFADSTNTRTDPDATIDRWKR